MGKLLLASAALAAVLSGCRGTADRHPVESGVDTVDASLPTQLPRTAIPSHYKIEVPPHADRLTFDAKVAIALKVIKPTRELVLNPADLNTAPAPLTAAQGQPMATKVSTDAD